MFQLQILLQNGRGSLLLILAVGASKFPIATLLRNLICKFCSVPDNTGGYKKVGCDECSHTGFKGRVPIAEVVRFKLGHGGDFQNPAEYMTVEKAAMAQYYAGFITHEDATAIIRGEEVWYD